MCVATHNTHSLPPPDAEKETHKRDLNMRERVIYKRSIQVTERHQNETNIRDKETSETEEGVCVAS